MNNSFQENIQNKAAAFQKMWTESLSKTMQAAWMSYNPGDSPPPELLRQIRSGIFEALGRSWEDFMRSPEFLRVMREWMEQAVSFRKMTNDLISRARNEVQAPSMQDVEDIMLAIRHVEKRLCNRIDELERKLLAEKNGDANTRRAAKDPVPVRNHSKTPARSSRVNKPRAGKGKGQ